MDAATYIAEKFPDKAPNSSGRIYMKCPFHDDNNPSFCIDATSGLFICRSASCGVRGNFYLFYKMMENISSWKEVYERLKKPEVAKTFDSLFERPKQDSKVLHVDPFPTFAVEPIGTIQYLESRGISRDTINKYQIQYGHSSPVQGSLVFPIYDIDGTYYTYQCRNLKSAGTRWMHVPGSCSASLLYGGWLITGEKPLLIVEGASDVWRLDTLGAQAIGLFTKEATSAQLNRITKLCQMLDTHPVVMLDGDVPDKLINRLALNLAASGAEPRVIKLDGTEDPGSLSVERFQSLLGGLL